MLAQFPAQISKFLPRLHAAEPRSKRLASAPTMQSRGVRQNRYIALSPAYSQSRVNATMDRAITTPLFLIAYLQLLYFHGIAHSFAQRRPSIRLAFSNLRTLSVATGVVPPLYSERSLIPLAGAFLASSAEFVRSATWTRRAHPTIIAASSRFQVYG